MSSTKVNFLIEQGTTVSQVFELKNTDGSDVDVTGYSANASMKKHHDSDDSTAKIFTTALANGSVTLSMTAEYSANIAGGRYVYDIKLTDASNNVSRPYEGLITVKPNVTD